MKKWLWRNRWLAMACAITTLMLLTAVGVNAALTVKPLPATVTVNLQSSPEGAFGFYSDSQGSNPITTFDFGQLKPGLTGVSSIYIKNQTVNTTFNPFSVTDDLMKGTINIFPLSVPPHYFPPGSMHYGISPGEVYPFDLYLDLDSLILPGTYDFTITVQGQPYQ
jgi:hypothetical protein